MSRFDFETLRKSLEEKDVELLLGLYSPEGEAKVVNKNTPPSRPFQTTGWTELETYIRDVCDRDLTHVVGDEVIGDDRLSYTETCTYPTGEKVFTANFLDLEEGLIKQHTVVETWDE